jgi:hypothetical protein
MTMPDAHYNRPMTMVQAEGLEANKQADRELSEFHSGSGWGIAAVILLLLLTWLSDQFPFLGHWILWLWNS